MSENIPPILCRPLIAPILYYFLRIEAFDNHVQLNNVIINYIQLGIAKDNLKHLKKYEYNGEYPNYKDVCLPVQVYDFIQEKSQKTKIGTGVFFMNYLVLGIKEKRGNLPNSLNKWFNNLKDIA